jgi:hypothetical protein
MSHADSNKLILAVMKTIHKSRRDLNATDSDNTQNTTAVDPTTVTPLRNLVTRLQAYLEMVETTPPRLESSPGIRNTTMSDVTAQGSVELGSASGVPRHQQTAGMTNHERHTFDQNLASHHQLFMVNTSTSSSTRPAPVPLTQLMDQAPSDDEDDAMSKTDAAQEALRVVFMDNNIMEIVPGTLQSTTRRKRPKYTAGLSYRYSSPPTRPTHVYMVFVPEERTDGYTTSSLAYVVKADGAATSQSSSTTPEEPTSRCPSNDENRG